MRVIKLSPTDEDMKTREMVDDYFLRKLHSKQPTGQFEIPKGWIAETRISDGELLVFSYEGSLVYTALSASGRQVNRGPNSARYPNYFCVDVRSIVPMSGSLLELEKELAAAQLHHGHLVQSQGWPIISEADGKREKLVEALKRFQVENSLEVYFLEGERRAANSVVRNADLRIAAKRRWGLKCYCCGFDFEEFYGALASRCAIVHHLEMFKGSDEIARKSTVDDVRIVCANCHYVIHKATPPLAVDELRQRIANVWMPWSDQGIVRR